MTRRFTAVFNGAAFVPEAACDLPVGSRVELELHGPLIVRPAASDQERAAVLGRLIDRLQRSQLDPAAPRLSRDDLHDRR